MPDLSHRPTRYALAITSAVTLAAVGASHYDVRVGEDPMVAAAEAKSTTLEDEVARLREKLHQTQGQLAAAKRAGASTPGTARAEGNVVTVAALTGVPRAASCATYPDQEMAQAAFLADPFGRAALDGDGDGFACEQLKSNAPPQVVTVVEPAPPPTEPPPPPPAVKPTAPSKAEILASGHHFGLSAATTEEYDAIEYSLAWDTSINAYFSGWDTPLDVDRITSRWSRGEVPMVTWESRPIADVETTPQADYALRRVIDGSFDAYLTAYAQSVAALGLPMVMRLDQEMNGNWYRWSEFESTVGNTRGEFAQAWRHVHDIFEQAGANDYVIWLWSPNRIDNLTRFPALDGYYPGASYVDWVGMTGYYRPGDPVATFDGTYAKTLADLRRVAPGKPILLSEVGATEDGDKKLDWVKTFFPGLRANPDVIGFVWFNYAVTSGSNTDDWRLTSSDAVFDAFRTDLKLSGFGRERGKAPLLVPASTPPPPLPNP